MQKQDRDEHVRSRAYEIWEQEGRPDGEHERHWRQASEEFEAGLAASAEATDLPCGAEGLATGLQPGSVTPVAVPVEAQTASALRAKVQEAREASFSPSVAVILGQTTPLRDLGKTHAARWVHLTGRSRNFTPHTTNTGKRRPGISNIMKAVRRCMNSAANWSPGRIRILISEPLSGTGKRRADISPPPVGACTPRLGHVPDVQLFAQATCAVFLDRLDYLETSCQWWCTGHPQNTKARRGQIDP
ncbi:DUF2934 domain-containing protein [Ciceribacter thiooxidans]|uniref:DUF2934 domain-containing protein n=1 Tax=Ciceribacter thiooxidans TaxID=1969821 RepID=UPI0015F9A5FC|nr:DUF2934 domain-containing protein [Ciceribacter thiooxidans]